MITGLNVKQHSAAEKESTAVEINVDQEAQQLQLLTWFCMKEMYYIKQKLTKQKAEINFFSFISLFVTTTCNGLSIE